MKKNIFLLIAALLLINCSSVKKHNAHLNDLISESKLKSDVDYTYKKLKKLQPDLYWYISKEKLDYKFDSIKSTINKPMTSFDFYLKLMPVVYSIRQGHMFVSPPIKLYTKKETKIINKSGAGPFGQFDFEMFNDKLYVTKNKSGNKAIKKGTEVVAINDANTSNLLKEYDKRFVSDGFNLTLKRNFSGRRFPSFYTTENGLKDSLVYNFKINDTLKNITIKRKSKDSISVVKKDIQEKEVKTKVVVDKAKLKAENKRKSVFGYNPDTKLYNRNLNFIEKDSSIAVMKINGFMIGNYRDFYKQSFQRIKNNKSNVLIIDLRNNGGGRLNEITNLYSYLADTTFVFLEKSKVASKTSLLSADYFKGGGIVLKAYKALVSPLYYGYNFFRVHKNDDGFYYHKTGTKPNKLSENAFKGKIYVLINGGSFSASSIISSNLKGSKRATFVGEETGGAYNGCVAGQMPVLELPKSKVKIRIGLVTVKPFYKSEIDGRGIFPDKEIIPTLEDRINGVDPEMNWILEDIKTIDKTSTK